MKPLKLIAPLVVAAAVAFNASAQQQQQPAAPKQAPAKEQPAKQTQAKSEAKQASPKEEWTKQYNAWKPKIDNYMNQVKANGDKYPDFTKEVNTLNQMAMSYNEKIARYDNATADQKAKYADMMKAEGQKVNDQAAKVKTMYDKNWPKAQEKKEAPKQPQK